MPLTFVCLVPVHAELPSKEEKGSEFWSVHLKQKVKFSFA
jgi:hypothetical protein